MRIPIDLAHRAEIMAALNRASAAFAESETSNPVPNTNGTAPVADPSSIGDFCYVPDFDRLQKATGEAERRLANHGVHPSDRPGCSAVMAYDLDTPEKNPTLGAAAHVCIERGDFSAEDGEIRYAQTGYPETGQWFLTSVHYDGCLHGSICVIRLSDAAIENGIHSIATASTPEDFVHALGEVFAEWHHQAPERVAPAQMQLVRLLLTSMGMMNPTVEALLTISRQGA